jgi:hypothetical protein
VFFVERLSPARERLHVWDRAANRWKVVAEEVVRIEAGGFFRVAPELGIIAYQVEGPSGVDAFLFDASLGRSVHLAHAKKPAPIQIRKASGAGVFVHWGPLGRDRQGLLHYEYGSGAPVSAESPQHPGDWPLVHRTDGSGIFQRRGDIVVRDSNGAERPVQFCGWPG